LPQRKEAMHPNSSWRRSDTDLAGDAVAKLPAREEALDDIGARKLIERALRESEARLRSVLESAPNMIISTDLEGRILFVNHPVPPATAAAACGKSIYDFVEPEDVARVRACVLGVLATGKIDAYEIRSPAPLGARWYSVSVGPVLLGDEPAGVTMVTWDITERRALEAKLAVSDRLASIGTLVSGVAHEINNPLMCLFGNLEMLRRGLPASSDASPLRAALDEVSQSAARIRDVVRDLTTVSREGDRELVAVDIHELVESAIRIVQGQLRQRARVTRDFGSAPEMLVSSARLGQVFMNLLLNAAHAIPEGRVDANEIRVSTRHDEGTLVVDVADTGEGIPPDLIGRVFDPFVTTRSSSGGTGLGLHICRNIVVAAGGTISVRSTMGSGTVFSVRLPLAASATGPKSAVRATTG
jgi:PAS domain S-box-containing protein